MLNDGKFVAATLTFRIFVSQLIRPARTLVLAIEAPKQALRASGSKMNMLNFQASTIHVLMYSSRITQLIAEMSAVPRIAYPIGSIRIRSKTIRHAPGTSALGVRLGGK